MILCSPSPGTSWPESTMRGLHQAGSSAILRRTKKRRCAARRPDIVVQVVFFCLSRLALLFLLFLSLKSNKDKENKEGNRKREILSPINGVPGVMQFESNEASELEAAPSVSPRSESLAACSRASASSSSLSFAALKRRERCWFILARGATPASSFEREREKGRGLKKKE